MCSAFLMSELGGQSLAEWVLCSGIDTLDFKVSKRVFTDIDALQHTRRERSKTVYTNAVGCGSDGVCGKFKQKFMKLPHVEGSNDRRQKFRCESGVLRIHLMRANYAFLNVHTTTLD